jgi:hypothetical protein
VTSFRNHGNGSPVSTIAENSLTSCTAVIFSGNMGLAGHGTWTRQFTDRCSRHKANSATKVTIIKEEG